MKKYIFIAVALVACMALSYALFFRGHAKVLQVSQVASDPAAYSGTVTVAGIMAGPSSQDPTLFAIFDLEELQCTTTNCKKFYLPVKTQGPLPKQGDELRISGSFVKTADGYFLSASNIKILRNHKIGG